MKIIDVRDGFIKFEADESIYLSSFVQVAGTDKIYIAQISQLKTIRNISIAMAKILFIMKDDNLYNYDKTEPVKDSEIKLFTPDILTKSNCVKKPIIVGKTCDNSDNIVMDLSVFDKKMLISTDESFINNTLVTNLSKQFNNLGIKTVIIDTLGIIDAKKIIAGADFKLPLNKLTLDFMYKSCLDDATSESKLMIADVFKDLLEYAETVPFVSFKLLKTIIDEMVDKQHIFRLFVLKNKLAKLEKLGYFADKQEEAENVKKLMESEVSVIDISKTDKNFQNCFLSYVYSILPDLNIQVLLETSNSISKQNLKMVLKDSKIPTTLIVQSKYKYLNDIKTLFDNFIIEPNAQNNLAFSVYSSFLESMNTETYLITGEGINYIPIVSYVQEINDTIKYSEDYNNNQKVITETDEMYSSEPETIKDSEEEQENEPEKTDVPAENAEDNNVEIDEPKNIPTQEEILANIEEKSEQVINHLSENVQEPQELDLFDEDNENSEELVQEEITEDIIPPEEIIEAEYSEKVQEPQDFEPVLDDNNAFNELEIISESQDTLSEKDNDTEEQLNPDNTVDIIAENSTIPEDLANVQEDIIQEGELLESSSEDLLEDLEDTDDVDGSIQEQEEIIEVQDDFEELEIKEYEDLLTEPDNTEQELTVESTEAIIDESEPENFELSADNLDDTLLMESDDSVLSAADDIVELNPEDADENDIIVDITDADENINIDEELDQQIVEDVDKVYTTIKEPEELEEISDSDLDLIDELNNDNEEGLLEEYTGSLDEGILEQPTNSVIPEKQSEQDSSEILEKRDSTTPIVPVYDADIPQEDLVVSDPIQQGDSVVHAKYGNGVVEKMIKYGTKTLFSINFENIGRRLLDPTLTEIKKL